MHFADAKLKDLALDVRPVKLRESLYLLIPVDIARLVGVAAESRFSLTLSESDASVKLVYELKRAVDELSLVKDPVEA